MNNLTIKSAPPMAKKKWHFFIIEDDDTIVKSYKKCLEKHGHLVSRHNPRDKALNEVMTVIKKLQPDCILCNLNLLQVDGLTLLQNLKKLPKPPYFISLSADYDHSVAWDHGLDGYINKPIDCKTFHADLQEMLSGKMLIRFWGIRGSLPVPGKKTSRYGGNTNCVTLNFSINQFLIFDAGTGLKELSNHLVKADKFPMAAKFFISHPHYDHINGIPFFAPFYMEGNHFELYGSNHGDLNIQELIEGQMDTVYFPITMQEFHSKPTFRNLEEGKFNSENLQISTIVLNHPGKCLGYRVQHKNKSFCYITDNELLLEHDELFKPEDVDHLIHFIKDANFVVMDSTYNSDCEYEKKLNWGHSCVSRVIDVADKANVKTLCLFHHDPDQYDKQIDEKLKNAKTLLKARGSKTRCIAAREGDKYFI
jgi:phosphoribosyl 1,2-cyclic phosphodiesterase/ActR/RegA family two-component response regulator